MKKILKAIRKISWGTIFALVATIVWLYCWYVYLRGHDELFKNPNAVGDFLAGVFSPIAFGWLVLGYFLQKNEIRRQRMEMEQLVEVNRDQINLKIAEVRPFVVFNELKFKTSGVAWFRYENQGSLILGVSFIGPSGSATFYRDVETTYQGHTTKSQVLNKEYKTSKLDQEQTGAVTFNKTIKDMYQANTTLTLYYQDKYHNHWEQDYIYNPDEFSFIMSGDPVKTEFTQVQ